MGQPSSEAGATPSMISMLWGWLTPKRRFQLGLLFGLTIAGAVAELATLGVVLAFLGLLTDPAGLEGFPGLGTLLTRLGWVDRDGAALFVTLLLGGVVLGAAGIRLSLIWAKVRFSHGLGHELGMRLYRGVLEQPYSFHVSRNTSEILSGINKVNSVVNGVVRPTLEVTSAAILALALLVGLLAIDWVVASVAAVLLSLLYGGISRYSRARVIRNSRIISEQATSRIRAVQEGLGGIRDVILDRSQPFHLGVYGTHDWAYRRAEVQNSLWGETPRYLIEALGMAIIAGLAFVAAKGAGGLAGALPTLGALAVGAQRLLPLFQRMYASWNAILGNRGYLEDLARLLSMPTPPGTGIQGDPAALPFERALTLRSVGFRYRADTPWLFRGLDLSIEKGARVGFTGGSGCGKSTLLDLIMGLLEPLEGHLEVDGTPLTPAVLPHWQARIAHVPQSVFLADTTMARNIAFGVPPAQIDLARAKEAARKASLDDLIETLPDGYETRVGERGVRLSGGQRQRLGIARALYREADVLVLDEATSALDGGTERAVMEGLESIGRDVTILIVAHRLSTLEGCDCVMDLAGWKMRQVGTSIS